MVFAQVRPEPSTQNQPKGSLSKNRQDDDDLDSTREFVQTCSVPEVSALPGSHLTPVFFKVSLDDIPDEDVPYDIKAMAEEASGGFSSFAFGNEQELDEVVQEVGGWIMGKGPTRKPSWQLEQPKIAGAIDDET